MKTRIQTLPRILGPLPLTLLLLTAALVLAPARSEAAIRVSARIGGVRIVAADRPAPVLAVTGPRVVVLRSEGRKRVVVRDECSCRVVVRRDGRGREYRETWIPGRYVHRHGNRHHAARIWVPGHWKRI